MNILFSKSGLMLSRTTVKPWSGSNTGEEKNITLSSRQISTFLRGKQSLFLNSILDRKTTQYSNLRDEFETSEKRFHDTSAEKTRIANLLFQQERQWRRDVEIADKKKAEAAALYIREHAEFSSHVKDIRSSAHALSNSTDEEAVLMPLEEKRLKLKVAHEAVLEATKEASLLKEKEEEITLLIRKFQEIKEDQLQASQMFHKVKSNFTSASRDLARVHNLVNSMTNDENLVNVERKHTSTVMRLAAQLWSHIEIYAMAFKQRN